MGMLIKEPSKEPSEPVLRNNRIEGHKIDIDVEPKKHRKKIMKMIKAGDNQLRGGGADSKGGFSNCNVF